MNRIDKTILQQAMAGAEDVRIIGIDGQSKNRKHRKTCGPARDGGDMVHLTDLGNAQRLVGRHAERLRYCHPWKKWLVYDGKRWRRDDTGHVAWAATETMAAVFQEVVDTIRAVGEQLKAKLDEHTEARLKTELNWAHRVQRWCFASEAAGRIAAMIELAKSRPGIPIRPLEMDRDPYLLNVRNGTIELRTGTLRPHSPADLITKLAPVDYDPEARAPLFYQFLTDIFKDHLALIPYLRRFLGLCLTGDVSEQLLHIFWGIGANGKSTLLNLILAMLGDEYAIKAAPDLLMVKRSETHPTERADLHGKRLVVCTETEENRRLAVALVKDLTGGDPIRARRMREDFWEFLPSHKLVICTNHRPRIEDTGHAIWRRVRLTPFTVTIPDDKQDKRLIDKLMPELPGVLTWCVQGCTEWQRDGGLNVPKEIRAATEAYRSEQDMLAAFIEERCFVNREAAARSSALYESYQQWAKRSGEKEISHRAFSIALGEKGFENDRGTGGARMWRGIGLNALSGTSDASDAFPG